MDINSKNSWLDTITPGKSFLAISLTLGALFIVITPPFQVPDEPQHFFRAYAISDGNVIPQKVERHVGNHLPYNIVVTVRSLLAEVPFNPQNKVNVNDIKAFLTLPLYSGRIMFTFFPQAGLYSPVPYVPQAIGISFGKICKCSPLLLMYLGRLANLVLWSFLVYIALETIPAAKWVIFLIALTPMSVFMAASLSPDAVTNALSLLTIAFFVKYCTVPQEKGISRNDMFFMIVVSVLLALSKQVYIFVPFLFLVIPARIFSTRRAFIAFMCLLIVFVLSTNILWLHIVKKLYIPMTDFISPQKQLDFIASNAADYLFIMFDTARSRWHRWVSAFFGLFGWMDTAMPNWMSAYYFWLLILVAIMGDREKITIRIKARMAMVLVFLLSYAMIFTGIYISFCQVGYTGVVRAIQGRYFIAISPLFFLIFYGLFPHIFRKADRKNIFGYSITIIAIISSISSLICALYHIVLRYYI